MLAAVAFLDAFQKVADMATNTRGRVLPTHRWVSPGLAGQGDKGGECPLWGVPCPRSWGGFQAAAPPPMETCPTCPHPKVQHPPGSRARKLGCGLGWGAGGVGTHLHATPHHPWVLSRHLLVGLVCSWGNSGQRSPVPWSPAPISAPPGCPQPWG